MPSCIRLAAIWLFVLVFQLFQEPSASTYMCRYKRHKEVISVEDAGYNCKTMKVKLGMCVGTCTSYAIPIPLEGDDNEPRFQTGCECCAPKDLKERTIRFGDGCEKSIVISQIRSCECNEHKSGISNYSHIRFANSADQEIFHLFISDSHITIYKDKQNDANLSYTSDYHNKRLMLWFCLYGNTYKLKLNKNGAEVSRTFSPNTIPIRKISFTNWQYKTELIAITNEFFDLDGPKHVYIASDFMK